MITQFSVTSSQLVCTLAILFLLTIVVIVGGKIAMRRRSNQLMRQDRRDRDAQSRTKYTYVDVMRYSDTFRILGFALAMSGILALVNWTTFEDQVVIPDNALVLEEDITIEPPRTTTPPPPPPPPPPPVIEEVPNELILDLEDDLEFMDQSIDAETVVDIPIVEKRQVVEDAPPPPPPPPIEETVEEIFKVVEEMPRFPGCEDAGGTIAERKACADQKLLEFIYENVSYPTLARENNIQGSVVVGFVVNSDGSIEQARVIRDIGAGCGDEALRVINLMTKKGIKWTPGKQRGQAVRVQFLLPVKFKLL